MNSKLSWLLVILLLIVMIPPSRRARPEEQSPRSPANILAAGVLTLNNATSVSRSVSLPSGSACQIQPLFDPARLPGLTYWVTWTANGVTVNVSSAASGQFSYLCSAGV